MVEMHSTKVKELSSGVMQGKHERLLDMKLVPPYRQRVTRKEQKLNYS